MVILGGLESAAFVPVRWDALTCDPVAISRTRGALHNSLYQQHSGCSVSVVFVQKVIQDNNKETTTDWCQNTTKHVKTPITVTA